MNSNEDGCRPAANVLGVNSVSCGECPFPFCVVAEAGMIKHEIRKQLVMAMRRLGNTMEQTAGALGITLRSVYRYSSTPGGTVCAVCNLLHSQHVVCMSSTYSVAHVDSRYVTILSSHRLATRKEAKIVEYFTGYVFPSSVVEREDGSHTHWVADKVEAGEEKRFQEMCNALDRYMASLNGGTLCPARLAQQQIR